MKYHHDQKRNLEQSRSLFDFDLRTIPKYSSEYGPLFPSDIKKAIDILVKHSYFDCPWDQGSLKDFVCYYVFYPTIVAQQNKSDPHGFYPFVHLRRSSPIAKPQISTRGLSILLAGCGCEETALSGYEAMENMFGAKNINLFKVIDLCSIPIRRTTKLLDLRPVATDPDSPVFDFETRAIQKESPPNTYDVIITDHLLGSSANLEYNLDILRNFHNLLVKDGLLITTIAADTTMKWQPMSHPGKASFSYFCERYGERSDGRDAKVGLAKDQWNELGQRYDAIMSKTYFTDMDSPGWWFRNAADIQKLFTKAKFNTLDLTRVKEDGTYESVPENAVDQMEGIFVVFAYKESRQVG